MISSADWALSGVVPTAAAVAATMASSEIRITCPPGAETGESMDSVPQPINATAWRRAIVPGGFAGQYPGNNSAKRGARGRIAMKKWAIVLAALIVAGGSAAQAVE